jgi:hypothetical protein
MILLVLFSPQVRANVRIVTLVHITIATGT